MHVIVKPYLRVVAWLDSLSDSLPPLVLRLLLAWEFGESGYAKFTGENWFADLAFPFPFNLIPADVSWQIATWLELLGAVALLLGLATRFISVSLMVLTVVAIASVHWPEHWSMFSDLLRGYRIVDEMGDGYGNYKLPLIYFIVLLPLLMGGAGSWSLDRCIAARWQSNAAKK